MDETFINFTPMGNTTTLEEQGARQVKVTGTEGKAGCTVAVTVKPTGEVLPLMVSIVVYCLPTYLIGIRVPLCFLWACFLCVLLLPLRSLMLSFFLCRFVAELLGCPACSQLRVGR
jgi:hypothetical protein